MLKRLSEENALGTFCTFKGWQPVCLCLHITVFACPKMSSDKISKVWPRCPKWVWRTTIIHSCLHVPKIHETGRSQNRCWMELSAYSRLLLRLSGPQRFLNQLCLKYHTYALTHTHAQKHTRCICSSLPLLASAEIGNSAQRSLQNYLQLSISFGNLEKYVGKPTSTVTHTHTFHSPYPLVMGLVFIYLHLSSSTIRLLHYAWTFRGKHAYRCFISHHTQ